MYFLTTTSPRSFRVIKNLVSALSKRSASTYEGDGKTSAQVLNKDLEYLMINAYSTMGFRLNSGIRLIGPVIIFPKTCLSWNISGVSDVNEDSLSLFKVLSPKVDIVVFGYGDVLPHDVKSKVSDFGKSHNIGFEVLSTDNAVATFNYLNHERRFVACALIPPSVVKIYNDNDFSGRQQRQLLLDKE